VRFANFSEDFDLSLFSEVIDVRSPAEFSEDHLPGAVNLPVLDDAQRRQVGEIYQQVDKLEARRVGAAHVARNAAAFLETHFAGKASGYRPLLYCWRGGQRSRSLAIILDQVGWSPVVLAGGYKSYRRHVREMLGRIGPQIRFCVVSGLTGSGKTRFLQAGARSGRQVLDLETLAQHRGSLLGDMGPQPTQKRFESLLLQTFGKFDLRRPVYVEGESKRIGSLWVPEVVWQSMTAAPVVELTAEAPARTAFLLQEYGHFIDRPQELLAKLETLRAPHGHARVDAWQEQIRLGQWPEFVRSLLETHYDPAYHRARKFRTPHATLHLTNIDDAGFAAAWEELERSEADRESVVRDP
jgi:tRNA 2-selenouridine synthase